MTKKRIHIYIGIYVLNSILSTDSFSLLFHIQIFIKITIILSHYNFIIYEWVKSAKSGYSPALGRVLNDAGDADGFCLKKINNISEFSSSKNNHQIIIWK